MPQNVEIVPKKPSADLSEFSDSFKVGDKNLDTVIEQVEPFINDAYAAMSDYLDSALTRKAEIKKAKEEELARRRVERLSQYEENFYGGYSLAGAEQEALEKMSGENTTPTYYHGYSVDQEALIAQGQKNAANIKNNVDALTGNDV